MKIGVLPLFVKNITCNPDWVAEFIGTVEEKASSRSGASSMCWLPKTISRITRIPATAAHQLPPIPSCPIHSNG